MGVWKRPEMIVLTILIMITSVKRAAVQVFLLNYLRRHGRQEGSEGGWESRPASRTRWPRVRGRTSRPPLPPAVSFQAARWWGAPRRWGTLVEMQCVLGDSAEETRPQSRAPCLPGALAHHTCRRGPGRTSPSSALVPFTHPAQSREWTESGTRDFPHVSTRPCLDLAFVKEE